MWRWTTGHPWIFPMITRMFLWWNCWINHRVAGELSGYDPYVKPLHWSATISFPSWYLIGRRLYQMHWAWAAENSFDYFAKWKITIENFHHHFPVEENMVDIGKCFWRSWARKWDYLLLKCIHAAYVVTRHSTLWTAIIIIHPEGTGSNDAVNVHSTQRRGTWVSPMVATGLRPGPKRINAHSANNWVMKSTYPDSIWCLPIDNLQLEGEQIWKR